MKRGRPVKDIPKTTTTPKNGVYYTVTEAVEVLGLHRHTIQARLRDGSIRGKLTGNTWKIYKDAIYTEGDATFETTHIGGQK